MYCLQCIKSSASALRYLACHRQSCVQHDCIACALYRVAGGVKLNLLHDFFAFRQQDLMAVVSALAAELPNLFGLGPVTVSQRPALLCFVHACADSAPPAASGSSQCAFISGTSFTQITEGGEQHLFPCVLGCLSQCCVFVIEPCVTDFQRH